MAAYCSYFSNTRCEFYPCHGIAEQNCLFCFCPLYTLDCGGDFVMLKGIKDCSACKIVHAEGGYEYVLDRLRKR